MHVTRSTRVTTVRLAPTTHDLEDNRDKLDDGSAAVMLLCLLPPTVVGFDKGPFNVSFESGLMHLSYLPLC